MGATGSPEGPHVAPRGSSDLIWRPSGADLGLPGGSGRPIWGAWGDLRKVKRLFTFLGQLQVGSRRPFWTSGRPPGGSRRPFWGSRPRALRTTKRKGRRKGKRKGRRKGRSDALRRPLLLRRPLDFRGRASPGRGGLSTTH